MADVSELLIEVKNINGTLNDIDKVGKKLKETQQQAAAFGKTLFAGWTFTKLIQGAKEFGDAWSDTLTTFRNFKVVFGSFNNIAEQGVKQLVNGFAETEKSARKLLATIGSRIDFNLDTKEISQMSSDLAKLSKDIGAFYNVDASQVSQKLTNALSGMTKGLRQFGISIDTSSPRFKELVKQMMISTGKTEAAAKALVIYNEVLKKSQKFKGSFETQAKTLSQAFNNISQSLNSGPFAKAGEVLSAIFVPILEKINDLINIPWVSTIMGIVAALGLVLASVLAIEAATKGIKAGIIKGAAGSGISAAIFGFLGGLLASLKTYIVTFLIGFGKVLLGAATAVIGAIAALPSAVIAAIIAVIAAAGLLLVNKLTTGQWFNFSGMVDAVVKWFKDVVEKIINFFKGKGFKTNEVLDKEFTDKMKSLMDEADEATRETNEAMKHFYNNFNKTPIDQAKDAKKRLDEATKRYDALTKAYQLTKKLQQQQAQQQAQLEAEYAKTKDKRAEEYLQATKKSRQRLAEHLKKLAADRDAAAKALQEAETQNRTAQEAAKTYAKAQQEQAKRNAETAKKLAEEKRKAALAIDQNKFADFTWYQDAMRKIQDGLGQTMPKDKIKDIEARINEFKKTFTHMTPDEQKNAYKELGRMQLEKFQAEMDMINKEREAIQKTHQIIQDYIKQAMEWKPRGVEGITASSAQGYKFMTSGFGNLASLAPVLQNTQNQQADLQRRANDIATATKKSIDDIKNKINQMSNAGTTKIQVVN